jgi:hypothetical protein
MTAPTETPIEIPAVLGSAPVVWERGEWTTDDIEEMTACGFVVRTELGEVSRTRIPRRQGELTTELCRMVKADPSRGPENAAAFVGASTRDRTRAIGAELYGIGGREAMSCARDMVEQGYGDAYARALDAAWAGIGDPG